MCGRFALTLPVDAARHVFEAAPWAPAPWAAAEDALADLAAIDRPRFNIRPTERVLVVARDDADLAGGSAAGGRRRLAAMRWGFLPHWAKAAAEGPPLINARAETIAEKPAFAKSARERRCLVPADGFYEWRVDAGRGKEPHWIHAADGAPLAFAAVWRVWRGRDGAGAEIEIPSVAIVTCAAEPSMADLHDRSPVVVAPEDWPLWLGEAGHGAARLMTAPKPGFFAHHPVSRLINKGGRAAPDGPELILPTEPGAAAPPGAYDRLL